MKNKPLSPRRYLARQLRKIAFLLDPPCGRKGGSVNEMKQVVTSMEELVFSRKLFLDKTLSMKKLAEEMGVNRTYLYDSLHSDGKTFSSVVNGFRLRKAAELISLNPKMRTEEVAESSGFANARSMNYYLQSRYRVTLQDFRQRISRLLAALQAGQTQPPCRMAG